MKNALLSVWNKDGLEALCGALSKYGIKVYSTGGTATHLAEKLKLPVEKVENVTQFPEMMDGRVKTLHPRVFGGILARRYHDKDMEEAKRFEIPLYDLVVVNLYPFWDQRGKEIKEQAGFVDIGGPAMIRAAAKNFDAVTVLSDPGDYAEFLEELEKNNGTTSKPFRQKMAARTFARTSHYDAMIASEWGEKSELPKELPLNPQMPLRYGENPHQKAAWAGNAEWKCLQGKELSYNNLLDAEAALRLAHEFAKPAVAIVKHNNPCGAASFDGALAKVFERALACDSKSAFGGIVATNQVVDAATAEAMSPVFLEVVLARKFDAAAIEILSKKKNLRLIEWDKPTFNARDVRGALGGWLVQDADNRGVPPELKPVTDEKPMFQDDIAFAWLVCKHVRSNAIVIAKDGATIGIGAGQMSRVDAVGIALAKCPREHLAGAVLASDAFFPFRDNIDLLKGSGIAAIVQPGGSQRDAEVIQACNELGIAMVFTGERHFRH